LKLELRHIVRAVKLKISVFRFNRYPPQHAGIVEELRVSPKREAQQICLGPIGTGIRDTGPDGVGGPESSATLIGLCESDSGELTDQEQTERYRQPFHGIKLSHLRARQGVLRRESNFISISPY
jgi:hypothetical protein